MTLNLSYHLCEFPPSFWWQKKNTLYYFLNKHSEQKKKKIAYYETGEINILSFLNREFVKRKLG